MSLPNFTIRQGKNRNVSRAVMTWFSGFRQGKYVIKALELKRSLTDLTPVQQAIYDHRDEIDAH